MKKIYLPFIILIVSVFGILQAQDCLPDGIWFSTQGQIDSFSINHPGCSEILGDVLIQESNDSTMTNLSGLSQITSIGGYLSIEFNYAMTSLTGLENLTSIGGYLEIFYNEAMTSLAGLENLTTIGGYLLIEENDAMTSLVGLGNLISMGGYLDIIENDAMTSLARLNNLTAIGGYLFIGFNDAMTSLAGLENLTAIGGYLSIRGNDALTSLAGLGNLAAIGGDLRVIENYSLTSLEGLENIDHTTTTNIELTGSTNLAICEVKSICDYLAIPINPATISGNTSGCNNRVEVEDACEVAVGVSHISPIEVQIYPNPTTGVVNAKGINRGQVEVLNSLGKVLMKKEFTLLGIDLSELPNGMYFIQIQSENQRISKRIIKL